MTAETSIMLDKDSLARADAFLSNLAGIVAATGRPRRV